MAPFLPPIEKPPNLIMTLIYAMTHREVGKVLTPMKVFTARLPLAFGQFYARVSQLDKKLVLSHEIAILLRQQVAGLNVCSFCIDIGRWYALKASIPQAKLDALGQYATSSLFTDAERAALDYATQLTRDRKVDRKTFDRLANYYSEREICEIVWLVASEHLYNVGNIALNIHSDELCES